MSAALLVAAASQGECAPTTQKAEHRQQKLSSGKAGKHNHTAHACVKAASGRQQAPRPGTDWQCYCYDL